MATFIEDLGIVSAYGEAVRKGYTGTEEEFAEMLANLPDKLAEAREYAASAAESSASAASSADGVQRNASIASTAASDAQSAAASALQSATFAETTVEGIEGHEEQCRIYRAEAVAAAEELKTTTLWNDALIDETVTGKIASFSDGCAGMPMKSIVAEITPVQSGSGDPSPTNIRPISGRTGLTVTVQSGDTQNTYPISWQTEAGTVYGGTLDVVSGVLTVDRAIITLDGSQNVSMSQSNRGYVQVADAMQIDASNQTKEKSVVCDRLKSDTWAGLGYSNGNLCCAPLYGKGVAFRNDEITTAADWKAYFQSNPTQFSYKLATPQTYQLTPTEVRTILGENLVYCDADDVTVNYYVDMKGYIDKRLNTTRMMIAGVETSFVATKNYAIGDFVIVNDTLYRITAVITSGETITPGTNASETTVAEQLIALYNA